MANLLPQCSHITRKRGVYFYRRRLPRPHAGEVALSLRTRQFRLAEAFIEDIDQAFMGFFAGSQMSGFDVRATLQAHLVEQMQQLRNKHLQAPYGAPVHLSRDHAGENPQKADFASIEHALGHIQQHLRERDTRPVDGIADRIIDGREITPIQRTELSLGLLQVSLQIMKQSRDWLTDGLIGEIAPPETTPSPPTAAPSAPVPEVVPDSPKLSEVLPAFLDYMTNDKDWRGQTLAQNRTTYRMLAEVCGDKPIASYMRRDMTAFYDVLRALPGDYSKARRWRGMALKEIVAKSQGIDVERLTMRTVERHFHACGTLFTYFKRRGEYEGDNPAHGFEFPQGKIRANQRRQMWEGERLTRLFSSPVWMGCKSQAKRSTPGAMVIKDDKYWLPILGLYHGNRLEEFAQLLRSDLRCTDGIWHFDINDDGPKQVKNEQSKRRVPLHPMLLTLGFREYVETIAPEPGNPVFPQLSPGGSDSKRGFYFTKWWSRYRQQIGVFEKGYDYHSFRHGMTTKLATSFWATRALRQTRRSISRACRCRSLQTLSPRWSGPRSTACSIGQRLEQHHVRASILHPVGLLLMSGSRCKSALEQISRR
jgi:hypothetical protein